MGQLHFCFWSQAQLWFSYMPLRKWDQSTHGLSSWCKDQKCHLLRSTKAISEGGKRGSCMDTLIKYTLGTPAGLAGVGWPCARDGNTTLWENFAVLSQMVGQPFPEVAVCLRRAVPSPIGHAQGWKYPSNHYSKVTVPPSHLNSEGDMILKTSITGIREHGKRPICSQISQWCW